jgi:hypothetical protein
MILSEMNDPRKRPCTTVGLPRSPMSRATPPPPVRNSGRPSLGRLPDRLRQSETCQTGGRLVLLTQLSHAFLVLGSVQLGGVLDFVR